MKNVATWVDTCFSVVRCYPCRTTKAKKNASMTRPSRWWRQEIPKWEAKRVPWEAGKASMLLHDYHIWSPHIAPKVIINDPTAVWQNRPKTEVGLRSPNVDINNGFGLDLCGGWMFACTDDRRNDNPREGRQIIRLSKAWICPVLRRPYGVNYNTFVTVGACLAWKICVWAISYRHGVGRCHIRASLDRRQRGRTRVLETLLWWVNERTWGTCEQIICPFFHAMHVCFTLLEVMLLSNFVPCHSSQMS